MRTSNSLKHGTHSCYSKGCRCEPCRVAHREYERHAKRRRDRARNGTDIYESKFTDTAEVIAHIEFLASKGIGAGTISAKTGLDRQNIRRIARGEQKKVSREVAEKVLAVSSLPYMKGNFVSSDPLKKLIKKLNKHGISGTDIGRQAGYKDGRLYLNKTVRFHKYLRIEKACNDLLRIFND